MGRRRCARLVGPLTPEDCAADRYTGMEGGRSGSGDGGFTLAELLVVIVILGILATVTVFAVREITAGSAETACATELDNLETAEEAHFTVAGSYADEATLLASGVIKAASSMYDIASDDSTYTITVASGAPCTSGATGGSSSGAAGGSSSGTPPVVAMGPTESHHGVTAWRYPDGDQGSAPDQILVFGGAGGRPTGSQRTPRTSRPLAAPTSSTSMPSHRLRSTPCSAPPTTVG